jgi:methylated-DNA-[protein]-cysteine S-methyltransferase
MAACASHLGVDGACLREPCYFDVLHIGTAGNLDIDERPFLTDGCRSNRSLFGRKALGLESRRSVLSLGFGTVGSGCDLIIMRDLNRMQRLGNRQFLNIESPIGPLGLVADGDRILEVRFDPSPEGDCLPRTRTGLCQVLRQAERELDEFFEGRRRQFELSLTIGGTAFQNRVWTALCDVPFGVTCSYSDLARKIDSPNSPRAVGTALGRNPLAIVVPCHRVIGADGSLVGFGGGLEIKRKLLEHEARFA